MRVECPICCKAFEVRGPTRDIYKDLYFSLALDHGELRTHCGELQQVIDGMELLIDERDAHLAHCRKLLAAANANCARLENENKNLAANCSYACKLRDEVVNENVRVYKLIESAYNILLHNKLEDEDDDANPPV